jgi:PPP family 3-phenylpropionic acid transporter
LLFAFASNLGVLFFSQALHALSFALFHSAAIAYLYQHYKNRSLAQQFFSGISYGLGGLGGALLAGYIYEYYPSLLFLSSSLIALGSLLMLVWYEKQNAHAAA